jgi:hydrogenase maturation factor HypE
MNSKPQQGGSSLLLDKVGAAITSCGLDDYSKTIGTRQMRPNQRFSLTEGNGGIKHAKTGSVRNFENIADLGL